MRKWFICDKYAFSGESVISGGYYNDLKQYDLIEGGL